MAYYSFVRRTKARLENFLAVPANRNWALIWILVAATLVVLTSDSFLGIDEPNTLDRRQRLIQERRQRVHKRSTKDPNSLNHPITWLIYKLKMRNMLSDEAKKVTAKANVLKTEITPENTQYMDQVEDLLISAYAEKNVTDPLMRDILGLTNETVAMDDPRLVNWMRYKVNNVTVLPSANWRQHRLELTVLEQIGAFTDEFSDAQEPTLVERHEYGKQIQADIYNKFYAKDGFVNKTFVQVGAKSRNACWECQIIKMPKVNWTGLVTEAFSGDVEDYLFARAAPFCVAPANTSGIYTMKKVGYKTFKPENESDFRRWTPEMVAKYGNKISPIRYHGTLLPLSDVDSTLTDLIRKNYTHVTIKAIPCFPLWTIMLATGVTDPHYLTIGTTGYAGRILESLPFEKLPHLEVIHLADLGDGNSTQKFLEEKGFKLDANLTKVEGKDLGHGDFVFYRGEHQFAS